MKPTPCSPRRLAALVTGALALACAQPAEVRQDLEPAAVPDPIELHGSAYDTAGELTLPDEAPGEYEGLHNVFRLSDTIVSGSEPESAEAYEELAGWGVRTVLSVDGKVPDAELAARYGLRYVHVPIQYKGITDDEVLRIAKTFRELEGPFYVHCFHGKHRGPAAAAIGRLVLDGAPRDRAIAEMRQWCKTSSKYEGLYAAVATRAMPAPEETDAYEYDFEPAHRLDDLRVGMVHITRPFDNLELFQEAGWGALPAHPDLDLYQEALQLHQHTEAVHRLGAEADWNDDFRGWMDEVAEATGELVRVLSACTQDELAAAAEPGSGEVAWRGEAERVFQRMDASCKACHDVYRN
jgi:protein tyrosine phosphatase (PTP) superfamily phosphohydrolase (DUF442 family)